MKPETRSISFPVAAALVLLVGIGDRCSVGAATNYWTNSVGGLFSVPSNWWPNGVPGPSDSLLFTNFGSYPLTVDFSTTNASAWFSEGNITQSIAGEIWCLNTDFRVGETAGSTSLVNLASGQLAVTNTFGSAIASVGRYGTGGLALNGGSMVADFLQAGDGARSVLTFGNGNLTTLHGSLLNNGTKIILGVVPNRSFVWNVLGGTNTILSPGFFGYGGLTLGGVGEAHLNLEGPGTLLTVNGLDTTGNNSISVRDGAVFRTTSVQLGMFGGSNVVVISGPGSSWINDYLMFFGMHAGGQTLLITNGGYFRTGGTAFSDEQFTFAENPGNRLIVTGPNSWFHSDGIAEFGEVSCGCHLDNLILITNGGRFWARQLTYGAILQPPNAPSSPGTVLNVADGSLWIGSLTFTVGTLTIGAGTGTIDQMVVNGGSNAVLQTAGALLIGHHGDLNPGELRVGDSAATVSALNGELELGGWQLGAFAGDDGSVTMTGGRAFVTNAAGNAALSVGLAGTGVLRMDGGSIQADQTQVSFLPGSTGHLILSGSGTALQTPNLVVGSGGTVVVSNAALFQITSATAPAGSISVSDGILQLASSTPTIPHDAITTSNAIISFRDAALAPVGLDNPMFLGRISRSGQTQLRLIQSTNALVEQLIFRGKDMSSWAGLSLSGDSCGVQAMSILIDSNAVLSATNTIASVAGSFTNRGRIILQNSTLRFADAVALCEGTSLQGAQSFLKFEGGLALPANDIEVPLGLTVQARTITSQGGRLIINGGAFAPEPGATPPPGIVQIENGWVTYFDVPAAPLAPPAGLSVVGPIGLELIRSSNAFAATPVFARGSGGYDRLRLGSGSTWQSQQLVIGQGGGMYLADPSATVFLTSGLFRVEQGGLLQDGSGRPSSVGFDPRSVGASATISGIESAWVTPNPIWVGTGGSQNRLLVELGGQLFSQAGTIGGSGASSNSVTLTGTGSSWFATNGINLEGAQSELVVQTGAALVTSQILANGVESLVALAGPDARAICTGQVSLSGPAPRLQVRGGGSLLCSKATLNLFSGAFAEVLGEGSSWRVTGELRVNGTLYQDVTNRVLVGEGALLSAGSLSLGSSPFGGGILDVQSGSVFVTNNTGTALFTVGGPFHLEHGLVRADTLRASVAGSSILNISAGRAEWRSCELSPAVPLSVGDGTNLATLKLLGGTNTCAAGLEVQRHAVLTGDGILVGSIINQGILQPSHLSVNGNVVLESASELVFRIAGQPDSPQNSSLAVTGSVSLAGSLALFLDKSATPLPGQSYVLLQHGGVSSGFTNVLFGQRLLTSDRLASFRIDDTGSSIIATDFRSEDLDGDGIQDSWALRYFGMTPLLPGAGPNGLAGDLDGDGVSNRDEFLAQTDPSDPGSCFRAKLELGSPRLLNIRFPYVFGHTYRIGTSEDLSDWQETDIQELRFDPDGFAVWSDVVGGGIGQRFYRLAVD